MLLSLYLLVVLYRQPNANQLFTRYKFKTKHNKLQDFNKFQLKLSKILLNINFSKLMIKQIYLYIVSSIVYFDARIVQAVQKQVLRL